MEGRRLRIEKAKCVRTLLIRNLSSDYDEPRLREYASTFGQVTCCVVLILASPSGAWFPHPHGLEALPVQAACVQFQHRNEAIDAYKEFRYSHPDWDTVWVPNHYARDAAYWISMDEVNKQLSPLWKRGASLTMGGRDLREVDAEDLAAELPAPLQNPTSSPSSSNSAHYGEYSPPGNGAGSRDLELPPKEDTRRQIFVGRLNAEQVTEEALRQHFSAYGAIKNLELVNRKVHLGVSVDAFCFITFEREEDAANAIAKENGQVWLGQAMRCSYAKPRLQSPPFRPRPYSPNVSGMPAAALPYYFPMMAPQYLWRPMMYSPAAYGFPPLVSQAAPPASATDGNGNGSAAGSCTNGNSD